MTVGRAALFLLIVTAPTLIGAAFLTAPRWLAALARLLPAGTVTAGDVVRPLGLDRYGYRLRVEHPTGHTDVRVPFPRPLTCAGQLHAATQHLLRSAS